MECETIVIRNMAYDYGETQEREVGYTKHLNLY